MTFKLLILALCCSAAQAQDRSEVRQSFDAGRALDYCAKQTKRALAALRPIDNSRAPRNILRGDTAWNQRPMKAEEWCSGFWPGILWMDYSYTRDEEVRAAAARYTEAVTPIVRRPVFDHDLGFIVINALLKATRRRVTRTTAGWPSRPPTRSPRCSTAASAPYSRGPATSGTTEGTTPSWTT